MKENHQSRDGSSILESFCFILRKFLFSILAVGPIPSHIAFIMDGNRRYSKKHNMVTNTGHRAGFTTLMSMLRYCYELGVTYVTVYAFSIDNFKRGPEEVESLMELMQEKIEGLIKEESIVNRYGVRVHFAGDLTLLREDVRLAAERAMKATAGNSKGVLSICVAYTSTNEIVHAVQKSCEEKWDELRTTPYSNGCSYDSSNGDKPNEEDDLGKKRLIGVVDIEKHLHMSIAPDPDILIRTSGESRLSNFLLWQSAHCVLYSPSALWPEIGLRHLVWAIINFQRQHRYLERKKKQM